MLRFCSDIPGAVSQDIVVRVGWWSVEMAGASGVSIYPNAPVDLPPPALEPFYPDVPMAILPPTYEPGFNPTAPGEVELPYYE